MQMITIRWVFYWIELFLGIHGVVVSSAFLVVLVRIRSMHPNLLLIFISFILSWLITSVLRLYYIVQLLRNVAEIATVMIVSNRLRNGAVYAGGLHLLLLACERLLATKRSRTYEKETHIPWFILSILVAWAIGMYIMFSKEKTRDVTAIASLTFIVFFAVSIAVMAYVRRTNLKLWQLNRCSLRLSHVYQVRENVETSTSFFRCFICFFVQTLLGYGGFVIANIFRYIHNNVLLYRIFSFFYDISVALAPTTIPILLILYDGKINVAFKGWFSKIFRREDKRCNAVEPEGNQLQNNVKQETETYFQQLKDAWA